MLQICDILGPTALLPSSAFLLLFVNLCYHCRNVLQYNHSHADFPLPGEELERYIPKCLVYALLWSFAGDAKLKVRSDLGDFIRSVTTVPLPPSTHIPIIDYEVSMAYQQKWLKLTHNSGIFICDSLARGHSFGRWRSFHSHITAWGMGCSWWPPPPFLCVCVWVGGQGVVQLKYILYHYLMVGTELAFKVSVLLAKFGWWKMCVVVQLSTFHTLI
jgi:hypothetical protein